MAQFRIRDLIRPYRYLAFGASTMLICFSLLGLTLPWMLKIALDKVLPNSDYLLFYMLCGAMIIIYLVRSIIRYIAIYLIHYTSLRILLDVRQKIFRHLQSLSLRFYEEYRTGKLISNVISDVGLLQQLVQTFISMSEQIFVALAISVLLIVLNVKLWMMVAMVFPLHYLNFIYFKRAINKDARSLQEKMSEISANLSETINGIKVVKSFAKERSECRKFFSTMRPTMDLGMRIYLNGGFCWSITDMLSVSTYLMVIGAGIAQVGQRAMTIGEFVAFYTYVGMLLGPINVLSSLATAISQGLAGAQRIVKLLSVIPEIKEAPNPVHVRTLEGRVSFEDVSFRYDDTPVIRHFSLSIEPGEKVALVGPSGCGKSTLSNLLLRFYDVSEGRILVDGVDVRRYAQEDYRSRVGVVLQEPFLFSGTIRDNIGYARSDATRSEIENAAKLANVTEFVDKLDDGFATVIGENGASLSGGQKQRLAIARAILSDPRILILDEATSALDTVSEHLVQEALDTLMAGRTTIIIAHRLSTIKNADRIVVLERGELVQQGTHEELMAIGGMYRGLYEIQQKSVQSGE